MSRSSPDRRPAARWIILTIVFIIGACTAFPQNNGKGSAFNSPLHMFTRGYQTIDAVYINPVDLGDLTLAGLSELSSLDPSVAIMRRGDKIEVAARGDVAATYTVPDGNDPRDWGKLTSLVVEAARASAPKLGSEDIGVVYKSFFGGALSKLDQFSRYSDAKEAAENRANREGFFGIGLRVAVEEGVVRVQSVMHYTPAERAGVRGEDIITHIDGGSVAGLDQEAVINLLRGPDNSKVDITLVRQGGAPFTVSIVRALIVPETVSYERHGDIANISLYGFNADTTESLRKEIANAQREIGADLKGIVLDLRDNPGGVLDESVSVADLFIDTGSIVSTHGRHQGSHRDYAAALGDITNGLPIVVMINGDSASAAEIVAAALQDSGRAVVIGTNSYGKGTVQQIQPMPNSGELTLTWARFHAPSGYTLHHLGVLPSVCIASDVKAAAQVVDALRRGRLVPIPTVRRNATDPNDTTTLDSLRRTCPSRHGKEEIDLQVATAILIDPGLYSRAIHLADLPPDSWNASEPNLSQFQP